jgi:NADPH:quinone reductase-like Zn-dependent oxidoreductase
MKLNRHVSAMRTKMKAILRRRYGSPDVLALENVEKPTPGAGEVLIKIRAASANPLDWHFMRGTPYFIRMMAGLPQPKVTGLGVDVAGEVEAVGRSVTKFKPGDDVFGACHGAFAEYACARESSLVIKPDNVRFDQAAAVATAALTALQGLRNEGHIQAGQRVLINGAAGGVGTFAVQIGKAIGADVTGVCSTRNVDMVRSIGADHVVDYRQEDFTKGGQRYDLVLDCIGNHSLSACRRVLQPHGRYVAVGGPSGRWMIGFLARAIVGSVVSRFANQKLSLLLTRPSNEDLVFIRDLMKAGKVTPVIDKRYPLSEVPEAIRYLEQGHARGKVVINVTT